MYIFRELDLNARCSFRFSAAPLFSAHVAAGKPPCLFFPPHVAGGGDTGACSSTVVGGYRSLMTVLMVCFTQLPLVSPSPLLAAAVV
ncbi:hypothetical protein HanOQP8_Chr02g0051661 [Helianthus annuus]|nr:hypothetical protein HanOQP8_Chr02g0051661 [Helianthus annuus]